MSQLVDIKRVKNYHPYYLPPHKALNSRYMARRQKINVALLRNMRKEAGYTQKELAARIGISRETVSAIENEKPETINSLEADVVSAWHIACKQGAKADTRIEFLGHIMKYFGFSEQNLIKMVKQISDTDNQE